MFVGLFVGSVVTYLLSRYAKGLPYTVVVFLVGVFASIIDVYSNNSLLGDSFHIWLDIPAELILFVFLPALLFGESMTLNPHHVGRSFSACVLLAGPGALIGMYLMAALAYYAFPYGWSWNLCCIFGAILCATDPVAVVALLHRVNASQQLTMLIVGEALLNDGSALVLFNMYYLALKGFEAALDPGNVIAYFLKVIFVSPIFGMLMGGVTVGGISIANRRLEKEDKTIQMSLTIVCAYLSFFVGEEVLGVSGVICCCAAGFTISLLGTPLILDHDTMSSVWEAIEWIGNTLLFLLAGLIIGNRAILYANAIDFGFIIVTYFFVVLVRVALIVMFFPLLANYGQKISVREAVFIVWAGLRGGVSLALALVLEHSAGIGEVDVSESEGHRVALFVGGFAAMTLVINAVSSSSLLSVLELVKKTSEDQQIIFKYVRERLRRRVLRELLDMSGTLQYYDFDHVVQFCSILEGASRPDPLSEESLEESMSGKMFSSPSPLKVLRKTASEDTLYATIDFGTLTRNPQSDVIEVLLYRVRFAFLEVVRHSYWRQIKEGKLPRKSPAAMLLLYSIDIGFDTVHTPGLQDWDQLNTAANINQASRSWRSYSIHELFSRDRVETAVFILLSFIEAHEEAQKKIPYYMGATELADTPEEAMVVLESQQNVDVARRRLNDISLDILGYYHSKQAARRLLHIQQEMIEDIRSEGILTESDASTLLKEIQKDLSKLDGENSYWEYLARVTKCGQGVFLHPTDPPVPSAHEANPDPAQDVETLDFKRNLTCNTVVISGHNNSFLLEV
jgi:NhaP-type Na+/H+ or K+/H+ antiporter